MFGSKNKVHEASLDDAQELLIRETKKEYDENTKKLKPVLSDLALHLTDLRTKIIQFKEKSVPNTYANHVKNRYCDKCLESINTTIPENVYAELEGFLKKADVLVRTVENPDTKDFRHLFVFKEDMSRIADQVKAIKGTLKDYRKIMEKPFLKNFDKTQKTITWMLNMKERARDISEEISNMSAEEKTLYTEIADLRNELEKNRKNYDDVKIENINREIESLEKQRNSIKQRIDTDFGGIMRPFRKAIHISEDGHLNFSKEEERIANEYALSEETFLNSDKDNRIRKILEKVKDAIDDKKLIVDEKERDKINMIFRSMDFFVTLKHQYRHIIQQIEENEAISNDTFGPFMRKRNDIETQITQKQKDITQLKNKMHSKNEDKIRLIGKITNDVEILQQNFKGIGIDAKIITDYLK